MVRSCTRSKGSVRLTNVVITDVSSRVSHDLLREKQASGHPRICCKAARLEPLIVVEGRQFRCPWPDSRTNDGPPRFVATRIDNVVILDQTGARSRVREQDERARQPTQPARQSSYPAVRGGGRGWHACAGRAFAGAVGRRKRDRDTGLPEIRVRGLPGPAAAGAGFRRP